MPHGHCIILKFSLGINEIFFHWIESSEKFLVRWWKKVWTNECVWLRFTRKRPKNWKNSTKKSDIILMISRTKWVMCVLLRFWYSQLLICMINDVRLWLVCKNFMYTYTYKTFFSCVCWHSLINYSIKCYHFLLLFILIVLPFYFSCCFLLLAYNYINKLQNGAAWAGIIN